MLNQIVKITGVGGEMKHLEELTAHGVQIILTDAGAKQLKLVVMVLLKLAAIGEIMEEEAEHVSQHALI